MSNAWTPATLAANGPLLDGRAVSLADLPPPPKRSWVSAFAWVGLALLLAWAWRGADMRPLELVRDSSNMAVFGRDFFPRDFHDWRTYVSEMIVTFHIALWGTVLAIVCAVPLGLMCAANVVPLWVYQPTRRVMDAFRAINEMVFAMLFIVAVGLGPFAGVLALWVHTTGVLAKLFAEAVEACDHRPVEGIRATGASALDEVIYGVIPQVLPLWISYSLYRFEANVRSASVVGMVGAGGIGVVLYEVLVNFEYAHASAVILILVVSVSVIDIASSWIRKRVT